MFGYTKILQNTATNRYNFKILTLIFIYNSLKLCKKINLNRDNMILIIFLNGNNYSSKDIPGFNIKVVCETTVTSFGKSLNYIIPSDKQALEIQKQNLLHKDFLNFKTF